MNPPPFPADIADEAPDIVGVILERVSQLVSADQRPALEELEETVRAKYAGQRVWIARRSKSKLEKKREAVMADALSGAPDQEIQRKHGISRATLYRMVKKQARAGE